MNKERKHVYDAATFSRARAEISFQTIVSQPGARAPPPKGRERIKAFRRWPCCVRVEGQDGQKRARHATQSNSVFYSRFTWNEMCIFFLRGGVDGTGG